MGISKFKALAKFSICILSLVLAYGFVEVEKEKRKICNSELDSRSKRDISSLTHVPDDAFENYLETHDKDGNVVIIGASNSMGNGIANDDYVFKENVENVTSLNPSSVVISDFTGLEAFAGLTHFTYQNYGATVTKMNVTGNTLLEYLELDAAAIHIEGRALDVRSNINLIQVKIREGYGSDPSLALEKVQFGSNTSITNLELVLIVLKEFDISGLTALKEFNFSTSESTDNTMNLSSNLNLEKVVITNSDNLYELTLPDTETLTHLKAFDSKLIGLDVSKNAGLKELELDNNHNIESLDLSNNPALTKVSITSSSELKNLNLKNGSNTDIDQFSVTSNPSLTCIDVDNPIYSTTNWTSIDGQMSFNTNCTKTYVPDDTFENYLETHDKDGNVVAIGASNSMGNGIADDDYVFKGNVENVTTLNPSSVVISDFTGLEAFTGLTHFTYQNYGATVTKMNVTGNTSLEYLELDAAAIHIEGRTLDVRNNTSLIQVKISEGYGSDPSLALEKVQFGSNTSLTDVTISLKAVKEFDVSGLTALKVLDYADLGTDLNTIILSSNPNLEKVTIQTASHLNGITLPSTSALTHLTLSETGLTSLNVSNNVGLKELELENNHSLESLDLSNNSALTKVYIATSSELKNLNLKNGSNTDIGQFSATSIPSLTCIDVDDPIYSTANWTSIDGQISFNTNCANPETYVPDDTFENYLETHDKDGNVVVIGASNSMGNGIANDNFVFKERIENVTTLNPSSVAISDFTGLEAFKELTHFTYINYGATVTNMNVTGNTLLEYLDLRVLAIQVEGRALDVRSNANLVEVKIFEYDEYDDDASRLALEKVQFGNNTSVTDVAIFLIAVKEFDVSGLTALKVLKYTDQFGTAVNTINLSSNENLENAEVSSPNLTGITLPNTSALTHLFLFDAGELTSLNVSNNVGLKHLILTKAHNLISLDLSNNSALEKVNITSSSELKNLSIKNGSNTNITEFRVTSNPSLTCIDVDDPIYSTTNWTDIDGQISFSTNCKTYVPDDAFENYLETHDKDGNVVVIGASNSMGNGIANDNYVTTSKINTVAKLSISGKSISDLTGIEGFIALKELDCAYNSSISTINISSNLALEKLICNNTNLTSLDPTKNSSLKHINCSGNSINSLDISNNIQLEYLDCSYNQLTGLDVSKNIALTHLNGRYNENIGTLDVSLNTELTKLYCTDMGLSNLDVTQNTALTLLHCGRSSFTSIDLTKNDVLVELQIDNSDELISLDLSQNTNLSILKVRYGGNLNTLILPSSNSLSEIHVQENKLTSIDVSQHTELATLTLRNNKIASLDLSQNTALTELSCNSNQLMSLNVKNGNNTDIGFFTARNNPNLTCIQVDDPAFSSANWGSAFCIDAHMSFNTDCSTTHWNGSYSTNWSDPLNWDGGVIPTSAANIIIKEGTNDPVISGPIEFNTMVLEPNTSLTVTGSVTNNGLITVNSGASLIAQTSVSGLVRYKRKLPAASKWYLVSSPVVGETIQDLLATQNFTQNASGHNAFAVYLDGLSANGTHWDYFVDGSTGILPSGKGYSMNVTTAEDIVFTGAMPITDVSIPITANIQPFNLIGNPYPSYIPANIGADETDNILAINAANLAEETIWFWDQSLHSGAGGYTQINQASAPRFIAPGQGFFISAKGTANFNFTETMQSHRTDNFQRNGNARSRIELTATDGSNTSSTEIYYIANTTSGWDNGYDSTIFRGASNDFVIYTHLLSNSQGENLGIQSLPKIDLEEMIIPIGINATQGSTISFSAEVTNIPNGLSVFLEDRQTNTFTLLENNNTYDVTLDTHLNDVGRFYIRTTTQETLSMEDPISIQKINLYSTNNKLLKIKGLDNENASIRIFDILGRLVLEQELGRATNQELSLHHLKEGIHLVELRIQDRKLRKKIAIYE